MLDMCSNTQPLIKGPDHVVPSCEASIAPGNGGDEPQLFFFLYLDSTLENYEHFGGKTT